MVDPRNKHVPMISAAALVVAYLIVLTVHHPGAVSTADSQGYFTQARRIAEDAVTYVDRESPVQFMTRHWLSTDGTRYYGKYSPGLPLLQAGLHAAFGPRAMLWLDPLMATAAVFAVFLLGKMWLGPWWGLLSAILVALNPYILEHALGGFAHIAVLFFGLYGFVFAALWYRTRGWYWAALAGLFASMTWAVRYPDGLIAGAVALYVLLRAGGDGKLRRTLLSFFGAAALPVVLLGLRNWAAFGAPWETGYGLSGEQAALSLDYAARHWFAYFNILLSDAAGPVFVTGLLGLALLILRPATRVVGIVLAAASIPLTLLYISYYVSPEIHAVRFLIPTYPVYALATAWLVRELSIDRRRYQRIAAVALIIIVELWALPRASAALALRGQKEGVISAVVDSVEANVPKGSVIAGDVDYLAFLDAYGHWKLADVDVRATRGAPRGVPLDGDEGATFTRRSDLRDLPAKGLAGDDLPRGYSSLTKEALRDTLTRELWKWAGPDGGVFFVYPRARMAAEQRRFARVSDFTTVATIDAEAIVRERAPDLQQQLERLGRASPPTSGPGGGTPNVRHLRFVRGGPVTTAEAVVIAEWTRRP